MFVHVWMKLWKRNARIERNFNILSHSVKENLMLLEPKFVSKVGQSIAKYSDKEMDISQYIPKSMSSIHWTRDQKNSS